MKKKPNAHADVPRNLIFPRAELVYLPVTPEVARAVENAVQMTLDAPLNAPNPRRRFRRAGRTQLTRDWTSHMRIRAEAPPDAPSCTRAACRFPAWRA